VNHCQYDLHECSSSDCEIYHPCGEPAAVKHEDRWYCDQHYDQLLAANSMEDL
jgi:hypothetical protein